MLLCVCVRHHAWFAYRIVGKISSLSASMNRREVAEQEHLTALDEFLRFYSLPKGVRHETRQHHSVMSRLHPFRGERHLIQDMSAHMRRAVLMHLHRHVIDAQPVLKFSTLGFQTRIVQYLDPSFCLAGAYLVVHGEVIDEMYFISNGTVKQVSRWYVAACQCPHSSHISQCHTS